MFRRRRRADDENDLAARFAAGVFLRQRRELAAPDFLVDFGKLAAKRGLARAKPGREIGERCRDPRPGLEQHQARWDAGEFGDARAPGGLFGRQKAREKELIGGQAGDAQRRQQRRSAGQRGDWHVRRPAPPARA